MKVKALISAVNHVTGEIAEFEVDSLKSLMTAYSAAQEYEKMAKSLKEQLKGELDNYLDEHGRSEELDGKQFKRISIQRLTYDKSVLRQVLGEDTAELFLKPEKKKIDEYIAENLESLGEESTKLRNAMIEDGRRYEQVKLEKLIRD